MPLGDSLGLAFGEVASSSPSNAIPRAVQNTTLAGIDTRCRDDLPLSDAQTSGIEVVGNALYRRFTTPTGALAFIGGDPGYGYPIQNLINDAMTPAMVSDRQSAMRAQALLDPRVSDATVLLSFNRPTSTLTGTIDVTLFTGQTFRMIVGVDGLTGETFYQAQ